MVHLPGSRTLRRLGYLALGRPVADRVRRYRYGVAIAERHALLDAYHAPPRSAEHARPLARALSVAEWRRLRATVSERGGRFFSDNLVSNESGYVELARELRALPRGLAYVGVGPEQIFSHLAWLEPSLAFVVDIRPANGWLHLLYHAMFAEARDRSEWLALLLGRPLDGADRPPPEAPAAVVVAHVERTPPARPWLDLVHERLVGRVETLLGRVGRAERRLLRHLHLRFFTAQLGATFRLHGPSPGAHPSLGQILTERSADGLEGGFLATDRSYQIVRRLEQELRVVPVVGDLAGDQALARIGAELRARRLPVGAVYVSNVEQYLFENGTWQRWLENLVTLPHITESRVVRAYLDQGRAHPAQRAGHRTTCLAQPVPELLESARAGRYRSWWELVTASNATPRGGRS